MRILKITATGLTLFSDPLILDLYASDRVMSDEYSVRPLDVFPSLKTQTVMAITGLNATGKTNALRLFLFVSHLLDGTASLSYDTAPLAPLFSADGIHLHVIYEHSHKLYLLETHILAPSDAAEDAEDRYLPGFTSQLYIAHESLWEHRHRSVAKNELKDLNLFKARSFAPHHRNTDSYDQRLLSALGSTRSIAVLEDAVSSSPLPTYGFIESGAGRFASLATTGPEITHIFDSTVDGIDVDEDNIVSVHFNTDDVDHTFLQMGIDSLLSVGTVRGIKLMRSAILTLKQGGYLVVDEIENSLNKKLVELLMNLFISPVTNPHNATLLFTTHYPELLDSLERMDNIYFATREGATAQLRKLSELEKRSDASRSGVFLANKYGGTAPKYQDIQALKAYIRSTVQSTND